MKIGDKAMVSPELTNERYWIDGEIVDIEQNPFKGIVIAIKDESGRIFFGEENISYSLTIVPMSQMKKLCKLSKKHEQETLLEQ